MTATGGTRAEGEWGILGGTFDPIHLGHLAIAEQTREALGLAGVLFVPAGMPPHKADRIVTAPEHRAAMVSIAIEDNPSFRMSRVELDRTGPSYAVDTLERLTAGAQADVDGYVFILSAEALSGLIRWREPERLLRLCRVAVVPRHGYRTPGRPWLSEHFPGQEERFCFLDGPDLGHSASDIRRLVSTGRSIRYLVPPDVETYIREHSLYGPELWQKN